MRPTGNYRESQAEKNRVDLSDVVDPVGSGKE
jgi:hypothetical protein